MTAKVLFKFCSQNLKELKYIYVDEGEVKTNECELQIRFKDCFKVKCTWSLHKIVPISQNKLRCFKTSILVTYEEILTSKIMSLAFMKRTSLLVFTVESGDWEQSKLTVSNKMTFLFSFMVLESHSSEVDMMKLRSFTQTSKADHSYRSQLQH